MVFSEKATSPTEGLLKSQRFVSMSSGAEQPRKGRPNEALQLIIEHRSLGVNGGGIWNDCEIVTFSEKTTSRPGRKAMTPLCQVCVKVRPPAENADMFDRSAVKRE